MHAFSAPPGLRRHLGTCILSTQNEVCSCCMLVACKAQRENESQSLSRRNRQRIVVIVIHKSNITVLRTLRMRFANSAGRYCSEAAFQSKEDSWNVCPRLPIVRSFVRSAGFQSEWGQRFGGMAAEVSQSPEGASAAFSQKGRDFRCIVRPLLTGQSVAASASRQGLRPQAALQQQSSSQSDEHAVPIAQPRLYPWKLQSHR